MDSEMIFWVVSAIVGVIGFGIMLYLGKKESKNYVEWVAEGDWE